MMDEQPFKWGDVCAFVDQEVVMLKAVTAEGDPEELTDDAAEALAHWLLDRVRQHRG